MAKKTGELRVTVKTTSGEALAGAEVAIAGMQLARIKHSGKDGRASFAHLPAGGPYSAAATAPMPFEPVIDNGLQVVFDQIAGDGTRTRLCDLRTDEPVAPGELRYQSKYD